MTTSSEWWSSDTVPTTDCIAAYKPREAASLAASYVNLVDSESHPITAGSAPAFDAAKGWIFGSNKYLKTDITFPDKSYSIIVCLSGAPVSGACTIGTKTTAYTTGLIIQTNTSGGAHAAYASSASGVVNTGQSSGVFVLAGADLYMNKTKGTPITQDGTSAGTYPIYIGALNKDGSADLYWTGGNIQYLAFYSCTLSEAQITAITDNLLDDIHSDYTFAEHSRPATNASNPLTTPTYDSSGQAVHPSVVYNASGWNGYKYWMAMTPYPGDQDEYENPSILASNDGSTWVVPDGLTNPVVPALEHPAFNSDPDLIFNPDGNTLYLYYRSANQVDTDTIHLKSSTDGVTWSAATDLFTGGKNMLLSPTVIYDGSQYVMWTVDVDGTNVMSRRTCTTPDGTWSAATPCTFYKQPLKELWHMDIVKNGDVYQMLIDCCKIGVNGIDAVLYFAQSTDGISWVFDDDAILSPGAGTAWDNNAIYRASGLPISGGYDLFYSAVNNDRVWHVGRTTLGVGEGKLIGTPTMSGGMQSLAGGMNG